MQINQENDWISSHHKSWRWPFTIPRHVCVGFSLTCSVSIRGEKSCDKERYLRTWFDLSFFCPITRLICRIHGLTARTVSLYWISRYLNSRLSAYLAYWAYIPRWDQPHVTPSPSPSSPSNALSSLTVSLSLYVTITKGFSADAGDNFSAPLIIMISTFDPGGWKPVSLSSTPPARFFSFSSFFFSFLLCWPNLSLSLSSPLPPSWNLAISLPFFSPSFLLLHCDIYLPCLVSGGVFNMIPSTMSWQPKLRPKGFPHIIDDFAAVASLSELEHRAQTVEDKRDQRVFRVKRKHVLKACDRCRVKKTKVCRLI